MGGHISVVWMGVCFLYPDHSVLPCSGSWKLVSVWNVKLQLPYMTCNRDVEE